MLAPNRFPELDCFLDLWRTSSNTKSKKSGTQSNFASVTLLAVCT
jgi:hypothetical protein